MFYKHADRILLGRPEHRDRALQQTLGEIGFRNEEIQDSGIRKCMSATSSSPICSRFL